MVDSDAVTLFYNVAEVTVGCIKQCYQGVIDQATRNNFLLLVEELIQYGVVLSGEMGEMDVSVIEKGSWAGPNYRVCPTTDKGGKNIEVVCYMLNHTGGCGGICVKDASVFFQFFYCFEDLHLLDVDDDRDLYALHFAFIPIKQDTPTK